ncbi:MAG: hypothetical protein HYZ65_15465 [Burkholderiales bacterium]|nr:hypothetical protein [Burkholderiales bacterium]
MREGTTRISFSWFSWTEIFNLAGLLKLFAPFMDKMMGADFEAGLIHLKKLAEQH